MKPEQTTFAYIGAFVDELAHAGVRNVCLAPGSRSTPLAMMVARHPDIKLWLQLDERSTAFFALGMAKASRQPVAILCSSGTATANFFPAVVEAGLRVGKLGNSSVRYEIGIFRQGDPAPAASGHFVHVYVDRATRRPVPVPDDMRQALARILA